MTMRFCSACGSPLIRFVWSLSRFNGDGGLPDICIPKPVAPVCFYGCSPDFVRSQEAVEAVNAMMDAAAEAAG